MDKKKGARDDKHVNELTAAEGFRDKPCTTPLLCVLINRTTLDLANRDRIGIRTEERRTGD